MENMDGTFDAEVVQLAGHFEEQQVILGKKDECTYIKRATFFIATKQKHNSHF